MYLYKFSNVDIKKLSCLASKTIWFTDLKNCNDPFEGTHKFIDNNDESINLAKKSANFVVNCPAFFNQISAQRIKEHAKQKTSDVLDFGSLSLSEHRKNRNPLLNNLMWSHYADGLTGYCLKFNKNQLISSIYQIDDISNILGKWAVKVLYSSRRPEYDMLKNNDPIKIVSTKSDHWKYENEFRLFSRQTGKHKYSPESLKEIILGQNMPEDQQKLICDIAKENYRDVKFKQAVLQQDEYVIKIIDLNYESLVDKLHSTNTALLSRDIFDSAVKALRVKDR